MELAIANRLIDAALAQGREQELPPLGVAVLDAGGHLVALQREDGLSFGRVRICQAKAYGALAMGTDSEHIAERYRQGPNAQGLIDAVRDLYGGYIVPLPGGVLIRDAHGHLLGAVGVSGAKSEEDADCARAGIAAVNLHAD